MILFQHHGQFFQGTEGACLFVLYSAYSNGALILPLYAFGIWMLEDHSDVSHIGLPYESAYRPEQMYSAENNPFFI